MLVLLRMILDLQQLINCTMNKLKFLKISVAALVVLNLGLMAFLLLGRPKHPRHPGREMGSQPKDVIIERLQFSAEQIELYDNLISKHRAEIHKLDHKLRSLKNDLYSNISNNDSIPELELVELNRLQGQIERTHYNHFLDIKSLCEADQLVAFQDLSKELVRMFAPQHPTRK